MTASRWTTNTLLLVCVAAIGSSCSCEAKEVSQAYTLMARGMCGEAATLLHTAQTKDPTNVAINRALCEAAACATVSDTGLAVARDAISSACAIAGEHADSPPALVKIVAASDFLNDRHFAEDARKKASILKTKLADVQWMLTYDELHGELRGEAPPAAARPILTIASLGAEVYSFPSCIAPDAPAASAKYVAIARRSGALPRVVGSSDTLGGIPKGAVVSTVVGFTKDRVRFVDTIDNIVEWQDGWAMGSCEYKGMSGEPPSWMMGLRTQTGYQDAVINVPISDRAVFASVPSFACGQFASIDELAEQGTVTGIEPGSLRQVMDPSRQPRVVVQPAHNYQGGTLEATYVPVAFRARTTPERELVRSEVFLVRADCPVHASDIGRMVILHPEWDEAVIEQVLEGHLRAGLPIGIIDHVGAMRGGGWFDRTAVYRQWVTSTISSEKVTRLVTRNGILMPPTR